MRSHPLHLAVNKLCIYLENAQTFIFHTTFKFSMVLKNYYYIDFYIPLRIVGGDAAAAAAAVSAAATTVAAVSPAAVSATSGSLQTLQCGFVSSRKQVHPRNSPTYRDKN